MTKHARRCRWLPGALFLLASLTVPSEPSRGDVPVDRASAVLVVEQAFPEPPRQRDDWKAPASTVPQEFVTAAWLLFQQGLADPRGCEYREIEVVTGWSYAGRVSRTRTHGWVLPAGQGVKGRFAVCWDGLVYPLVSSGKKADLRDDVAEYVDGGNKAKNRFRDLADDAGSVSFRSLDNLQMALLLRLGEGNLASAVWKKNNPKDNARHSYLALARAWGRTQLHRAHAAHQRGGDAEALYAFRQLTAFTKQVEAQAKVFGFAPDKEHPHCLRYLEQLPDLLADQERRAKAGPREAVVRLGPGRHPDANKRIAALIARLDEVQVTSSNFGWHQRDPIIDALIREGPPALDPLLQCFEDDRRLTRGFYFDRYGFEGGRCIDVHELAEAAIDGILGNAFFPPASEDDQNNNLRNLTWKEQAARLREKVKRAQWLSPAERRQKDAERWFNQLADDKAQPSAWQWAADRLVYRPPSDDEPTVTVWSNGWAPVHAGGQETRQRLGESLRGRKNPSVTELILKRVEHCDVDSGVTALLGSLAEWEPKAARVRLAEHMLRLRDQQAWRSYVEVVDRRCKLGDFNALDDYIAWTRTVKPDIADVKEIWAGYQSLFTPMLNYPSHPGMAEAAALLFENEKSPWLPLVREREGALQGHDLSSMLTTNLLRQPSFRKAVLKELANKGGEGAIEVDPCGSQHIELPGVLHSNGGGGNWRELDIPEEGVKGKFRICDFVAWQIGEYFDAAPRCELYWSEEKRDKAVEACVDFLRRYGDHLFLDSPTPKRDKPATADDVRSGKAIFSLAAEGESRVVPALKLPLEARWVTLKHRPHEWEERDSRTGKIVVRTGYRQNGRIVQAEEVWKDGKWQRYYGFVGCDHIARVPADEIAFPPPPPHLRDREWQLLVSGSHGRPPDWVSLPSGFHARLDVPPLTVELIDDFPPRLPANAPLVFGLVVRNSRGIDQESPAHDTSVRVRLLYSPETISRQGALVPQAARETEWVHLTPKPDAAFNTAKAKILAPTEEIKAATFDLREWFDLSNPGFYRLQLLPAATGGDAPGQAPTEVRFSLAAPERQALHDK
jgi:hypothetical protein